MGHRPLVQDHEYEGLYFGYLGHGRYTRHTLGVGRNRLLSRSRRKQLQARRLSDLAIRLNPRTLSNHRLPPAQNPNDNDLSKMQLRPPRHTRSLPRMRDGSGRSNKKEKLRHREHTEHREERLEHRHGRRPRNLVGTSPAKSPAVVSQSFFRGVSLTTAAGSAPRLPTPESLVSAWPHPLSQAGFRRSRGDAKTSALSSALGQPR